MQKWAQLAYPPIHKKAMMQRHAFGWSADLCDLACASRMRLWCSGFRPTSHASCRQAAIAGICRVLPLLSLRSSGARSAITIAVVTVAVVQPCCGIVSSPCKSGTCAQAWAVPLGHPPHAIPQWLEGLDRSSGKRQPPWSGIKGACIQQASVVQARQFGPTCLAVDLLRTGGEITQG
jgi:hypothetical protein